MTGAGWVGVLGPGDRVRLGDVVYTVVGVSGMLVRFADEAGNVDGVALPVLQARDDFVVLSGQARRVGLPPVGVLDGFPAAAVERALWWERHILEVLHGQPPAGPAGAVPRPEFDPARASLTRRERAKAAELVAAGHRVTASTIKRLRQCYQAEGVVGLVDHRVAKKTAVHGRVDDRVVAAMRTAIGEAVDASSRTASYILWRTEQLLLTDPDPTAGAGVTGRPEAAGVPAAADADAQTDPDATADAGATAAGVVWPSRRTLYRLFGKLSHGLHTTGSARTRRSLANRPPGPFGELPAAGPGELMQIDSTPLDVLVRLEDGVTGRVDLTAMIDVATRTVTAAVLRPATKSVDASVLLARTVTPEPMRPGWVDALRMSRSVLPHRRLLSIDERLEHAAARPVIIPETIVCDHGKVFVSRNFRASCRFLGINFQPAHPGTPTDKPQIERTLGSVATLFAQFVAGYTGSHPDRRGRGVEHQPLWSLPELQELLDEWVISGWQNRPHDGLRDPDSPGRAFTPNERYATLIETAGYLPVALSGEDYIELLPARWQAINAYGIRIKHRTYDAEGLNPLRRQPSGITQQKDRWEIHHDPYDVSRIWVRDPSGDGWITAFWTQLHRAPVPFGELAWDHTRQAMPAATEEELADAVTALLQRANRGPDQPHSGGQDAPATKRDRRVAARTRVTSPTAPGLPAPDTQPGADSAAGDSGPHPTGGDELPSNVVVPLGIFDPLAEAQKPW